MTFWVMIGAYLLMAALVGWIESKILLGLQLGGRTGGMVYAVLANVVCSVVAPIGVTASVAAGFLGLMGAINNTKGITGQDAFNSYAGPIAAIALCTVAVVRILPMLVMNWHKPFSALCYSLVSTGILAVGFTVAGITWMAMLPHSDFR